MKSATIVELKREPNPEAVKQLQILLARAQTGDLQGFVCLYDAVGFAGAAHSGWGSFDAAKLVLAFEIFRLELLERLSRAVEPVDDDEPEATE